MKLKRCTCSQCKYGIRTKAGSEIVQYKVRAARHHVKQLLHQALSKDVDVIGDTLPVYVNIGYTD